MQAKAMSRRLPTKERVIIATAEGRQREMAIPLSARNRMICVELSESPHPRMKAA